MKTKDIRQEVEIKATPNDIYEILMDEKKHAKLIGSSAKIDSKVSGKFELYDGDIHGEIIELIPKKKIVEKWRYNYSDWNKDYFSTLTINIEKKNKKTSIIKLEHTGIPEKYADEISEGWYEYYWNPMKVLLEK